MTRPLSDAELLELVEAVRLYAREVYGIEDEGDLPFIAQLYAARTGLNQPRVVADYCRGRLLESRQLIASLDTVPRLEDNPAYQAAAPGEHPAPRPRNLRQIYGG